MDNAEVAIQYFKALSSGDVAGAVDLITDDGQFLSPMGEIRGKDAIRAFLGGFDTAFPGATFDIANILESGRLVAIEGIYRGTHDGPLATPDGGSISATGRTVSAPFVTIFEVVDGAITAHRPYWDVAGFMAQLTG